MTTLEVWLIAIGLAMDCFAVSIASGIVWKQIVWRPLLTMAFAFGFFQAAMPFVGWLCANKFSQAIQSWDHWIAFFILLFLGGRMIQESMKDSEAEPNLRPDRPQVVFIMAIATSIDALAVGISFAFLGYHNFASILSPLVIIGFVSFLLSMAGTLLGIKCGKSMARKLKAEFWGGILLICIGTKILIEHLFFQS